MLGYERLREDNNNFSRAYCFNFPPHMGLRASLRGDRKCGAYMLTNGVQQTEDFNNPKSNHAGRRRQACRR